APVCRDGGVGEVEVGRAAGRRAFHARLDRCDVVILPTHALIVRDEDVLLDRAGRVRALVPATAVEETRLREVDRAVRPDVAVEGKDVARRIDHLRLGPGRTRVV